MVFVVSIHGSENQRSKLRNGKKVRVRHGSGFNVLVSPTTYNLVSKTFARQKGMELSLSPEEIEMNKLPSPELQAHVMGKDQPLLLPGVGRGLYNHKKGSGIGDWFRDLGNTIKTGFQDKIIKPVEEKIIKPAEQGYNQYVKPHMGDITTALKVVTPPYLIADAASKLAKGQKLGDIAQGYKQDLTHLNNTKNQIIKSSPVLTTMYKSAVPALAGAATAGLAGLVTENPYAAALAGAAGQEAAKKAIASEGYGIHHMIHLGMHLHPELMKHHSPIGGAIKWNHIVDFFKNAGHKVAHHVNEHFYKPAVQAATQTHNWLMDHPEMAYLLKEHGSKLAGLAAKYGVQYLTGDETLGDIAGDAFHEGAYMGADALGYGFFSNKTKKKKEAQEYEMKDISHILHPKHEHPADNPVNRLKNLEKLHEVHDQKMHMLHSQPSRVPHFEPIQMPKFNYEPFNELQEYKVRELPHRAIRPAPPIAKRVSHSGKVEKGHPLYLPLEEEKPSFWSRLYNWWFGKGGGLYLSSPVGHGLYGGGGLYGGAVVRDNLGHIHQTGVYTPHSMDYEPHMMSTSRGGGFHSYESLRAQNIGSAMANMDSSLMSDRAIAAQHMQPPIKSYWGHEGQPPSRGHGIHTHRHDSTHHKYHETDDPHDLNLVGGVGRLALHQTKMPPALQSQPYGANFHMQFMLPPQYQRFNDGTDVFG